MAKKLLFLGKRFSLEKKNKSGQQPEHPEPKQSKACRKKKKEDKSTYNKTGTVQDRKIRTNRLTLVYDRKDDRSFKENRKTDGIET